MTREFIDIPGMVEDIRYHHSIPQTCPGCQKRITIWQAADNGAGFDPDKYDGRNHPQQFACPSCRAQLRYQSQLEGPVYVWFLST
jgi:hypothetical protein